jgi:hypothetical protein
MMRIDLTAGILAAFLCVTPAARADRCILPEPSGACSLLGVSLVALLASPDRYHGKRIQVVGFVHLEFEGNALYLHREDYERGLLSNALWLNVSADRRRAFANTQYALVEGTFNAEDTGHMNLFSGSIDSIARLEPWPSRAELDAQLKKAPESSVPSQ